MKRVNLFAAVLVIGLAFGACSDAQKKSRGSQQNVDNLNPAGLPIVKQKESFTILVDDSFSPEKTMSEIFERETNVHVNYMVYPTHVAAERKNILIASGDYPDVIAGWLVGANDVITLAAEEAILPLEDLIDTYTVNIKEVLDMPGIRKRMTLPDGHIYSPPYVIEEPMVTFHPWINVKWLKQLGLSMPATTEEFKQVLVAFRDNIPPVRGQKIIPFSWDPNQLNLGVLANWFGLDAHDFFTLINGQIEITINRPEFKEFLIYFSGLYREGLLDPELFTQDKTSWTAKGKQGLYGGAYCYWPDDFAQRITEDITVNQWDYEALPPLRAPGLEKPQFRRSTFGATLFRTQFIITDNAVNPITIIKWLDYVYGEQQSLETKYGPLGLKFEKLPDGRYREIDISSWTEEQKEKYDSNNNFIGSLPKYMRPGNKVLPPEGKIPEYDIKVDSDALYEPYLLQENIPDFWLDRKTAQDLAVIAQPIGYYYRQKIAEWISGQADINAEWDAYAAELDRLGIQNLLKINRELLEKQGVQKN
jgi:putative aldouronate transport system substrate-binding protein